ncbi:MAG TPA: amino acid adenylation domain-containing protein [Micromonosporaceae bacterium]
MTNTPVPDKPDAAAPGLAAEPAGKLQEAMRAGLGPPVPFPHDRTVLDLFHDQVTASSERPAVRFRDLTLSYAELDRAANAAASHLIRLGAPRGTLIPLLITDGPEFPSGLLGVLKAGAAFVPLDPNWPADRLRAITTDLDPPAVLAVPDTAGIAASMGFESRTVILERGTAGLEHHPDPKRNPTPTDLIYGYYTSGSTGIPKCALNQHRGLVNRLAAMSRRFGDGAGHIALQNSRSTFDSAMWQVLWPLTSGGQVVLPHRDGILDLEQTALTIGRYGVTITDFVPSVLAAFVSLLELREDLRQAVSCMRRMLIGGEAANPAVVRRLRDLLPDLRVTNTYGPTECSIGSVFHDITDADTNQIPLGRPIDNTAAIVLGDSRQPLPIGIVGEIHLGGECIGAGYLNDPQHTSEAFIPNPFPQITGDLLYRTGDLGTVDDAGLLHFVGRRDDQVKVGGVRVELGEVARALAAHPKVGDAMAVLHGERGDRLLVCCVSPRTADNPPTVSELRRYATERLPAELMPHRIMVLGSLPVSENGKADRKALTALLAAADDTTRHEADADPANPMEELVLAAWQDVLGLERISVTVPFREYGGTSLAAYRLTVELSSRLGRPVRPRDVLASPTVRTQAARLAGEEPNDTAELDRVIRDIAWRPPQVLLLTGVTGFIGAHLLADLLRHSDAKLICLTRAASADEGRQRLLDTLEGYRLTSARQLLPIGLKNGRVEVVLGELGKERLGVSAARYSRLTATVTAVVHAGALVNLLAGYLDHRPANVVGTQELIKFAAAAGCRLHSLSTLSIFPLNARNRTPVKEDQLPVTDELPRDGYSLSKYVAEKLLTTARGHGISSVVYRLGEVWPHRDLGVPNPQSVAHTVFYACVRAGCYFRTDAVVDVTPVDTVSRFITRCATGETRVPDGALHLLWPHPMRFADAFAALAARRRLEPVSYTEFRRRLEVLAGASNPDETLARLSLVLPPANHTPTAPPEFDEMFIPAGEYFDRELFRRLAEPPQPTSPLEALDRFLTRLASVPGPQGRNGHPAAIEGPVTSRDLDRTFD